MAIKDYFRHSDYVLDKFWFDYLEGRYVGRGIMTWEPKHGFHIEAPLRRYKIPQVQTVELGKVGILRRSNTSSIRMKPWYYDWAFTPAIPFIDRDDVLSQHRLSVDLNRVVFMHSHEQNNQPFISGSSLYEVRSIDFLFDFVVRGGVEVAGHFVKSRSRDSKGIFYEGSNGEEVKGYLVDDKYLELYWKFPVASFAKRYCWRWSEAVQYSLSILLGQTVSLLYRDLTYGTKTRVEMRKQEDVKSLGLLSLYNHKYGKAEIGLTKRHFVKIADFLARDSEGSDICRNIFNQVSEAAYQKNWQTRELILSTVLEAVLRNVDKQAFQPGKTKGWDVGKGLTNFFQKYLASETWKQLRDRVMREHTYLRDRNAHPDWLFTQGGTLSEEEREKALDSMIFLSRFYGYMIFSLIGVEDLKPVFPKPHREWEPMLTMEPPILKQELIDLPDSLF